MVGDGMEMESWVWGGSGAPVNTTVIGADTPADGGETDVLQ